MIYVAICENFLWNYRTSQFKNYGTRKGVEVERFCRLSPGRNIEANWFFGLQEDGEVVDGTFRSGLRQGALLFNLI